MKHLEDLTRMHTNEAIQTGLKSQSTYRALARQTKPATPTDLERQDHLTLRKNGWVHSFTLLYRRILNFVE
jgi:hypothetical protein